MDLRRIIKEELQTRFGQYRFLWVSSNEQFYINGEDGMYSPTEELTYEKLMTNSLPTEEEANRVYETLQKGWIHYLVDEVSWDTRPMNQHMIDDLKLVRWFVGAHVDTTEDVFDMLDESTELDWIGDHMNQGSTELELGNEYEVIERVSTLRPGETFVVMDRGTDNHGGWVELWVNDMENVTYRYDLINSAIPNSIRPLGWKPDEYPRKDNQLFRRGNEGSDIYESEDFSWIEDVTLKPNKPQPHTAWVVMNIGNNDKDMLKVQEYLFSVGFTWPSGSTDLETYRMLGDRFHSIGSVWQNNINEGSFTYVTHDEKWDESMWLKSVTSNTDEDVMDVYVWTGNETVYSHSIDVDRTIQESCRFIIN